MKKTRTRQMLTILFLMILCLGLTTPLLASADDDDDDTFSCTLHIVVQDGNPIQTLRAEYIAEALENIGIEGVIHPIPWWLYWSCIFPSNIGLEDPGPSGPPQLVQRPAHFHHTTDDGGVMWCGADDPSWATPPGYGNNWNDFLMKGFQLPPTPVNLAYRIQYDTELNYDRIYVGVSTDQWKTGTPVASHTGNSGGFQEIQVDLSSYAGQVVDIAFQFISDPAVSDEDGGYDSDGGCRLDWVEVTGHARDNFDSSADGWVAKSEMYQGWDITNFAYAIWNYEVIGFNGVSGTGYSNPKLDKFMTKLEAMNIDWYANFPDPPELTAEAQRLFNKIQRRFIKDPPELVLWSRWNYYDFGGITYTRNAFPVMVMNYNNEHLAHPTVRRAISFALDRQTMMEATEFQGDGMAVVQTYFTPAHPVFDPKFLPIYDLEKAQDFIEDYWDDYDDDDDD